MDTQAGICRVQLPGKSLTASSDASASPETSPGRLQLCILRVPFLSNARQRVFRSEAALVARLLLPSVIWTALALSGAVADELSLERDKHRGKQLNLTVALCWTNKLTSCNKGQVKLMARSPVLLWDRVQ